MGTYSFPYGGGTLEFEAPEGLPPEQVAEYQQQVIGQHVAAQAAADKVHVEKSSLPRAAWSGWQGSVGRTLQGLGEFTGIDALTDAGAITAEAAKNVYEAPDERDTGAIAAVRKGYKGYGLDKAAQGIAGVAPMLAIGAAGAVPAMAAWGVSGLGEGTLAATEEQQRVSPTQPADMGNARLAGAATGLLNAAIGPLMNSFAGLGEGTLKALAPKLAESMRPAAAELAGKVLSGELAPELAQKMLSTTAMNFAKSTLGAAGVGAGLGVGSTAITMGQAGENVVGPEAMERYGENVKEAAFLAPFFGAHGAYGKRGKQEQAIAQAGEQGIAERDMIRAEQQAGVKDSPEYAEAQAREDTARKAELQQRLVDLQSIDTKAITDEATKKAYNKDVKRTTQELQKLGGVEQTTEEVAAIKPAYKATTVDELIAEQKAMDAQKVAEQEERSKAAEAEKIQLDLDGIAKQAQRDNDAAIAKFDKELAKARTDAEKKALQDKKDAELAAIKATADRLQTAWEERVSSSSATNPEAPKSSASTQRFADQYEEYHPTQPSAEDLTGLLVQEAGKKQTTLPGGFVRPVYSNPAAAEAARVADAERKARLEKSGSMLTTLVPDLQKAVEGQKAETAAANAEPARRVAAIKAAEEQHTQQATQLATIEQQLADSTAALQKRAKQPIAPDQLERMDANLQKAIAAGDEAKAERLRKQIGPTEETHNALLQARNDARTQLEAAKKQITEAQTAALAPVETATKRTYAADFSPQAHKAAWGEAQKQLEIAHQTENPGAITEALRTMQELRDQRADALVGNVPTVKLEASLGDFGHMLEVIKPRTLTNTETLKGVTDDLATMHERIAADALRVAQEKATAAGKPLEPKQLKDLNKAIYGKLDAHQRAVLSAKAGEAEPAAGERTVQERTADNFYTDRDAQRTESALQEQLSTAYAELKQRKAEAKEAKGIKEETARNNEIAKTSTFIETAQAKADAYQQELLRHRASEEYANAVKAERTDPTFGLHQDITAAIDRAIGAKEVVPTEPASQKLAFDIKRAETPQGKAESRNDQISRLRQELELRAAEDAAKETKNVPDIVKPAETTGREGTPERQVTAEEAAAVQPAKEVAPPLEKPAPLSRGAAAEAAKEGRLNQIVQQLRAMRMRVQRSNEAIDKAKTDEARTAAAKDKAEAEATLREAAAQASGTRREWQPVEVVDQKGVARTVARKDGKFAGKDYLLDLQIEAEHELPTAVRELRAKIAAAEKISDGRVITKAEQTSLNLARQELSQKQTRMKEAQRELKRLEADTEDVLQPVETTIKPKEQKQAADFTAEGIDAAEQAVQRRELQAKRKGNPAAEIERADMLLKAEKLLNRDDAAIADGLKGMSKGTRERWETLYQGLKGEPYSLKALEAIGDARLPRKLGEKNVSAETDNLIKRTEYGPAKIQGSGITKVKTTKPEVKPSVPKADQKVESKSKKTEAEKFAVAEPGKGMDHTHVQSVVDMVRKAWKSLPDVKVLKLADMTPEERAKFEGKSGYYRVVDGKAEIGLIAENLHSPAHVMAKLFHEGLGHFGLARKYQTQLDGVLNAIYKSHGETRRAADAWLDANPDVYKTNRVARAVEEVLAHASEQGTMRQGVWNRVVATVRDFGRKMGLVKEFTTNDVRSILRQAHEAAKTEGAVPDTGTVVKPAVASTWDEAKAIAAPTSRGTVTKIKDSVTAESGKKFMLNTRAKIVDHWAHTEAFLAEAAKRGLVTAEQRSRVWTNMSMIDSVSSLIQNSINKGIIKLATRDGGKGWENGEGANLLQFTDALKGHDMNQYATWERFIRAQDVGFDKVFGESQAARARALAPEVIAEGAKNEAFVKAREISVQINKDIINMLVESGRLSEKEAATWKPETYTPAYSTKDNGDIMLDGGAGKPIRVGNARDIPGIKQLLGGEKDLMPYLDGRARNVAVMTQIAVSNYNAKSLAYLYRDIGLAKITAPQKRDAGNTLQFYEKGEMKTAILDRDKGIKRAEKLLEHGNAEERTKAKKVLEMLNETNYISLPDLMSNLGGTVIIQPKLMKVLTFPARVLHTAITRNPLYPLRQFPRDLLNAYTLSGGDSKVFSKFVKTAIEVTRGKNEAANFLERTGAGESNILKGQYDDIGRELEALHSGKYGNGTGLSGMMNTMRYVADKWATTGDMTVRAMLFETGKKKGMTDWEAREYSIEGGTNFKKHGSSQSVYWANMITPFLNSQMQGLDLAVRATRGLVNQTEKREALQNLIVRGGTLALSSLMYHALVSDEDWYKGLSPTDRANNYFYKFPWSDEPFRFPIPFESGTMFKAMPEAIATLLKDSNGLGEKEVLEMLRAQALGNLPGGGIPLGEHGFAPTLGIPGTVLKTAIEAFGNFSFQTGAPIESQRMLGLQASERMNEKTTEFAKQLGDKTGLSPLQIDHAMNNIISTIGTATAHYLTLAVTEPRAGVEKPTALMSQDPFLKGFFAPVDGSGIMNTMWHDVVQAPQQAEKTFKDIVTSKLDPERAKQYAKDHPEMAFAGMARDLQTEIGKLSTMERQITNMPDKTGEWKREQISAIHNARNLQGQRMLQIRDEIAKLRASL